LDINIEFIEKKSKLVNWVCVEDKCDKCKGKLITALQNEMAGKTYCIFHPNLAEVKFKVKLHTCRKTAMEGDSVAVRAICKEEFSKIYAKGHA
jgi:hypothetical protein